MLTTNITTTTNGINVQNVQQIFKPNVHNVNDVNSITFKLLINANNPSKTIVCRRCYNPGRYVNPATGNDHFIQRFVWIIITDDDKTPSNIGKVCILQMFANLYDELFSQVTLGFPAKYNINNLVGLRSHDITLSFHYNPDALRVLTMFEISEELTPLYIPAANIMCDYVGITLADEQKALANLATLQSKIFDITLLEQDYFQ